MRFLVDNNLSPQLAKGLQEHGHEATHVRDLGLSRADDETVLRAAREQQRVLISADTDFGTLLARTGADKPSVILFRRDAGRRPNDQLRLLVANLRQLEGALTLGSVVVLTNELVRIRSLPLR